MAKAGAQVSVRCWAVTNAAGLSIHNAPCHAQSGVLHLCFVLATDTPDGQIDRWVEQHRTALETETGDRIDPILWRAGFSAALYDVLVSRLTMYALINRVRPQPFLPRVVKTWRRLYERFPLLQEA